MIVAMMLPLLLPLFTMEECRPCCCAMKIVAGYFVMYIGAAYLFAVVHTRLQMSNMVSDEMVLTSLPFTVFLISFAVFYRLTKPGKKAKQLYKRQIVELKHQKSSDVSFRTGIELGYNCLKCNWLIMFSMLAFGMMNIFAMAIITAYMIWDRQS